MSFKCTAVQWLSLVHTILFSVAVSRSYAIIPPLGDVNCQEDQCALVNCTNTDCSFGKLMNDPSSVCGCCKVCINYKGEYETCGTASSNTECGPGLFCALNSTTLTYSCTRLSTPCNEAQDDYDYRKMIGTLGMYESRPNCDANGDFVARMCQPGGSCYCVNKANIRIFGESEPSRALNDEAMNCECSRSYETAFQEGMLTRVVQFPHCLPNGNYDQLQCVNQACFCIDSFNQSLVSPVKPITDLMSLPCYNEDLHAPGYYRLCEQETLKKKVLLNSYGRQNMTILGIQFTECTPDGFYKALRETESSFFCADPFGKKIENYEIGKEIVVTEEEMNCKCARTRYWLASQNVAKPSCCKNGSYRPVQCRGGVCFCVDSDGNQTGIETPENRVSELPCYKDDQYPFC